MIVIKMIIVMVWSWKKINSSIKGEHAFWKLSEENNGISKRKVIHVWSLNSVHYSATLEELVVN